MTLFYKGIVKKGSTIIAEEISGVKSVIIDLMVKHIEMYFIGNKSTKAYIKAQVKQFKDKEKLKVNNVSFEIIKKDL